jgi:hypothetical protein
VWLGSYATAKQAACAVDMADLHLRTKHTEPNCTEADRNKQLSDEQREFVKAAVQKVRSQAPPPAPPARPWAAAAACLWMGLHLSEQPAP